MTTLLWLPLWVGIVLLLLAIPVISSLPPSTPTHHHPASFSEDEEGGSATTDPLLPTPPTTTTPDLKSRTTTRLNTIRSLLTNPSRNLVLLLTVFFLASLASSDTKLLTLYISNRYTWKFSSVGYLLSLKAVFNFFLLWFLVPRFLRWQQSSRAASSPSHHRRRDSNPTTPIPTSSSREAAPPVGVQAGGEGTDADAATDVTNAHTSLLLSVLGALAIALAPSIVLLVPALLLYALGIALPMFTYSLLKAPGMGVSTESNGPGTQLFSVVMLVRTVGTLVGAVVMPALWVAGLGVGGWGLGMPFVVSAGCYAVAGGLVRRIAV
jgi:hypothetical protein